MKIAAIDIGSNSIHMIVARIDGDGSLEIIDRHKEMARLGQDTLVTGFLSEEAQERGLDALKKLKALAESYSVDDIVAVATSATREARNGEEFVARIEEECGIQARTITGVEEGRLIYLGTREVYAFGQKRALIIDIGGGSVELLVADQRRESQIHSLKLGVRRLKDRFLANDPPSRSEVNGLQKHIESKSQRAMKELVRSGFDEVLGTSGTANTLVRLCAGLVPELMGDEPGFVPLAALDAVAARLLRMTTAQLDALPMIDDRRRDTVTAGAVLMAELIRGSGGTGFRFVDAALREGMIVDYLEKNRPELRLEHDVPDPRRRSVLLLARRLYFNSTAHPQTVARLAIKLFDDTRAAHGMDDEARELLEHAAILHNVGTCINRAAHHKHALYIIRNATLHGFSDRERLIMANLARYHRRSAPKSRHPEFMEMEPADRDVVRKLSSLLRVAHALDRGHRGNVHTIHAQVQGRSLNLDIQAFDDASLELTAVREHIDYVHSILGLNLTVRAVEI